MRPRACRALPRSAGALQANTAPPEANRGARGAGPAVLLSKATCWSTAPARGQLSRRRARALGSHAADSLHAGERRCSLHGNCGMRGPGVR